MPPTVVSSPGKVLIAGGYLVLDPAYSGIVVSTSSRFYTIVKDEPRVSPGIIQVRSPQFKRSTWKYIIKPESETILEPSPEKSVSPMITRQCADHSKECVCSGQ